MSKTLLYVDDSVTMQKVAEITFRGTDWEYRGARNRGEAQSAAKEASPALILVDAKLGDESGYDLAKELKSSGAVVVMVCGNSEVYDEGKGSAAGCDGHIVKPWQTDKIVVQLGEIADAGPTAAPAATASEADTGPASKPAPAAAKEPPRSATLMGMPALEMPPSKPLPEGVASLSTKPAVPALSTKTPAPPAAARTPAPPAARPAARAPMIKGTPGKPIRLVLASQAQAAAESTATSAGLSGEQASALTGVSREVLEQIIWEVVPDLAESIIRENLDTLTAKAR